MKTWSKKVFHDVRKSDGMEEAQEWPAKYDMELNVKGIIEYLPSS